MKPRNLHQLAIIRGEARGHQSTVSSKKHFSRKIKYKNQEQT